MLTQQAIDQSSEIEAINQQLELTNDRQDYARNRQWTNYLTLDPIRLVQNVLGGGDVQRDRLTLAALELETANLIRRREAVAETITRDVVNQVFRHIELRDSGLLIYEQLLNQQLRQAVAEAKYRTGQSNTDAMLQVWQRTEELDAKCQKNAIQDQKAIRDLYALLGEEYSPSRADESAGMCIWGFLHEPISTIDTEGSNREPQ